MNKRRTGFAAMLSIVLWLNVYLPGAASRAHSADKALTSKATIRNATVLITMLHQVSEEKGKEAEVVGKGIGTSIAVDGVNYLVTHNHWGDVLQDWTKVEIYDSENRLLKLMMGEEFIRLVRYQDEGTLILQIPQDLEARLTPAAVGDPGDLQPGETVQIAYRKAPSREKTGVLTAIVEEMTQRHGLPAYKLRSQDGGSIQQGDSGGGVWHDGKFVGNLWTAIVSVTNGDGPNGSKQQPTDTSYAAIYPEEWSPQQVSETAPRSSPTQLRENGTASAAGKE